VTSKPSAAVLQAFGLAGGIELLAGGYETSVRVGQVVLKQVMDLDVAAFCQQVLSGLTDRSVTVPKPLRTQSGEWSADGWTATRFVEGLSSARNEPALLIKAGRELAEALVGAEHIDGGVVRARTDRWAVSERFVFDEVDISLSAQTDRVVAALRACITDEAGPTQLIHADLAGNVFVDPNGTPVVLDFTPAFRPVGFQTGVILADTLLWGDSASGPVDLHVDLLNGDTSNLARGLLFRLIAAELAVGEGNADLASCESVIAHLDWR